MKKDENNIEEVLERSLPSASTERMESARERIFNYVQSDAAVDRNAGTDADFKPARGFGWQRLTAVAAVAALLIVAIWIGLGSQAGGVDARLGTADGSLSRVSEGKAIPVRGGERIEAQEIVRSGSEGSAVALADGSRAEMREGAELSLEHAEDGVRIHLRRGDLLVHAAKQIAGHLYVQTRDLKVSVVGTVFLVRADDNGSRVAVIEGEVHVQQGTVEKSLRPGEQLASNPKSENLKFFEETGWSREAFAYLSKLHESMAQSLAARQSSGRTTSVSGKPKFEEASIRLCEQDIQAPEGARGGGSDSMRISPGRVDAVCMTLPTLIRTAHRSLNNNPWFEASLKMNSTYGLGTEDGTRVRGGPDWVRSEKYTIAAVADSTDAAALQGPMLLDLLERRFKLKLRVETEETPVYTLTIAKGGLKIKPVELGPEWHARIRAIAGSPEAPRQAPLDPRDLEELLKLYALVGCSQLPEADQDDKAARSRFQEAVRRGELPPVCGAGVYSLGPNTVLSVGGGKLNSLVGSLSREAKRSLIDTLDGRLVVDKTGLPDTDCFTAIPPAGTPCAPVFNIRLEFAADESYFTRILPPGATLSDLGLDMRLPKAPNVFDALEKLGLHLEKSKAPREFIVIEHIERPSDN